MNIPKCEQVKLCCIKCGKLIKHDPDSSSECVNVGIWREAIAMTAYAGYKSKLEGTAFIVLICDRCLLYAASSGSAHEFYNRYDLEESPMN